MVSPPARESGCAGSTANQPDSRRPSREDQSPRYGSSRQQHASPVGVQMHHRLQYRPSFYHPSSGLTRDNAAAALARNSRTCRRYTTALPQLCQRPLPISRFVSQPAIRISQSAVRILQWNANGLSTKVHELRQRVLMAKIYIYLIKETKLVPKDPTPAFPSFPTIRLLALVKGDLVHQRIAEDHRPPDLQWRPQSPLYTVGRPQTGRPARRTGRRLAALPEMQHPQRRHRHMY